MKDVLDLERVWDTVCGRQSADFMVHPYSVLGYDELVDMVRTFCSLLDSCSIDSGDRVVIHCADERLASISFIACLLDGKVPVMLGADCGSSRLNAVIHAVQCSLLVTDTSSGSSMKVDGRLETSASASQTTDVCEVRRLELVKRPVVQGSLLARIGKLTGKSRGHTSQLILDGAGNSQREPVLPADPEQLAYLLFTSGTTSEPSGVRILRRNLFEHLMTLTQLFSYDAESRVFNATPLAHTDGLVHGLLIAVVNGATVLRAPPIVVGELEEWLDHLRNWRATHFVTNPTVLGIIDRYASHDDYVDHQGFVGIISSAAHLGLEQWERLETRLKCSVFNLYGMTETVSNALYAGELPGFGRKGTIGQPIDCEARIKIPDDGSLAEGIGELQIRGGNVCDGYWNNPVRTEETISSDGWLRTGDLVRQSNDGSYEFQGRLKSVINCGGTLILPQELDEVLCAHPSVTDSVTVGIADPLFEEVAVSCVQVSEPVSDEKLFAQCRMHLEALKVPKHILQVQRIPRGDAGKPLLVELRELVAQQLSGTSALTAANGVQPTSCQRDIEAQLLSVAADVFHTEVHELNLASSPACVPIWDSFTHINLVLAIEENLDVTLTAAQIAGSTTLGQLLEVVKQTHRIDPHP